MRRHLRIYTVLSPDTPRFADLIRLMAAHLGVKAPTRFIPVKLARVLLKAGLGKLTGSSPEPLSFLVPLAFDVASAEAAALRVGLARSPIEPVIRKDPRSYYCNALRRRAVRLWSIQTIGQRRDIRQQRSRESRDNSASRSAADRQVMGFLRAKLERPALVADLPGQGRSELIAQGNETEWLLDLTRVSPGPLTLIAHSYACRAALQFTSRHPGQSGPSRFDRAVFPAFATASTVTIPGLRGAAFATWRRQADSLNLTRTPIICAGLVRQNRLRNG